MKYDVLIEKFRNRPYFESPELHILINEPASRIESVLSRWVSCGKLVMLRKSKYLLPEKYRTVIPSLHYISNYLYSPSYVSLRTALAFHKMIPDVVYAQESVTTKKTAGWDNEAASFKYFSVCCKRFWGYNEELSAGQGSQNRYFIARPEKALLDIFYLLKGEWSNERLNEMRFQNLHNISLERLNAFCDRFESRKAERAVKRFIKMYKGELSEG